MRDEALATGIRCPDYFPCGLVRMDLVPGYLDEGRGRDVSPDLYEFSSGGVHAIRLRI